MAKYIIITVLLVIVSRVCVDAQPEKIMKQIITKCGDSFSMKSDMGAWGKDTTVWQYKNLKWKVLNQTLTEAEKLNGIESMGVISISFNAYREFNYRTNSSLPAGWSEWKTPNIPVRIQFEKRKGEWSWIPLHDSWIPIAYPLGSETPNCKSVARWQKIVKKE